MFTLKIKLNKWGEDAKPQIYGNIKSYEELADWLFKLVGPGFFTNDTEGERESSKITYTTVNEQVVILSDKNFEEHQLRGAFKKKISSGGSFFEFLLQILNPFKWLRHGVTFATMAVAIGVGFMIGDPALLTPAMPTLMGIVAIGLGVGLPIFILYGLRETFLEYQQTRAQICKQAIAGGYVATHYSFKQYLWDLLTKWKGRHPGQHFLMVLGVLGVITLLILTVPYCVDPTGSFAFMSDVLQPVMDFLSAGFKALSAVPQLEFLSFFEGHTAVLAIAASLLIAAPLSFALSLKRLFQGKDEIIEASYSYEEDKGLESLILPASEKSTIMLNSEHTFLFANEQNAQPLTDKYAQDRWLAMR